MRLFPGEQCPTQMQPRDPTKEGINSLIQQVFVNQHVTPAYAKQCEVGIQKQTRQQGS